MYPASGDLKTGYGILCRNNGLEPWLIRWVLGSRWNHIAVVAVIEGQPYIVEAKGGQRLGLVPYGRWCAQAQRQVEVIRKEIPLSRILSYCGLPYDYPSCLAHLWRRLTGRWYGHKAHKAAGKLYCFEYYALLTEEENWYMAGAA